MTSVVKYSKTSNSDFAGKFEQRLCSKWNEAMKAGLFLYQVDDIETKVLNGKYKFTISLNTGRFNKRCNLQKFSKVHQVPSPSDFNFTKVSSNEVLFDIINAENPNLNGRVLINISPTLLYNSLIVPNVESRSPQMITYNGLLLVIDVLMMNSKGKIFFSSMCGYASVNHEHYHLYLDDKVNYLQKAELKLLKGYCYEIVDYPAKGFVFVMDKKIYTEVLKDVTILVDHLVKRNIPHNIAGMHNRTSADAAIRLVVWARKSSLEIKEELSFCPSSFELSGHLINVKSKDAFNEISEEYINDALKEVTDGYYNEIRHFILHHPSVISKF